MTILSLDILDPTDAVIDHWSSAPGLKGIRHLEFKPGLNVLFAPNGYGKSTILKLLAALTHCLQGGPPVYTGESFRPWAQGRGRGVRLTHDGSLCFYADPSEKPGLIGGTAGFDPDFFADGVLSALAKNSSGEWCVRTLNRIVGLAVETKTIGTSPGLPLERLVKEDRYLAWRHTQDLNTGAPRQPTILLDEFDRSLDLPMVMHVWSLMASRASQMHQLIVAGHNAVLLRLADLGLCNLIDLCPGYVRACREALAAFDRFIAAPTDLTLLPRPFTWKPPPALPVERPRRSTRGPSKAR